MNAKKNSTYMGDTTYLYGGNGAYLANMYRQYLEDKNHLSAEWIAFFSGLQAQDLAFLQYLKGEQEDGFASERNGKNVENISTFDTQKEDDLGTSPEVLPHENTACSGHTQRATLDTARAMLFIRAYRLFGHHLSTLDPLGLVHPDTWDDLDPKNYGFDIQSEMDRPIFLNDAFGLKSASLRQIIQVCRRIYCGNIGFEYLHCSSKMEKDWFKQQLEYRDSIPKDLHKSETTAIFTNLAQTDSFEIFLAKKYPGMKRFGLDGSESIVPLVENLASYSGLKGVDCIVMGMSHRGRLNILCNVLKKPYAALFKEFLGGSISMEPHESDKISGDVKYHLGASATREFGGRSMHISLCPNPSHLESVNTVVLGKVRAKQVRDGDVLGSRTMGLLLHGDASFIGQGVVAETFLLSQLDGYGTGGTIHVVLNNQIGFTTKPSSGRSSRYCSDIAKVTDAPILHVNGDDVEACVIAARLAVDYRMKFRKDIVIDVWCYRRHGHNESDEPMFTQPIMYNKIRKHPRVIDIYRDQLLQKNALDRKSMDTILSSIEKNLHDSFVASKGYKSNKMDWLEGSWQGLTTAPTKDETRRGKTNIDEDMFQEVTQNLVKTPKNFTLHPKLIRRIDSLKKAYTSGKNIDWSAAEALAFGSLLLESTPIRLSGEDSQRGTFSQRHAVWIDQGTESEYIPLNNLRSGQARFTILDSPLSEFGLLGFEYGYAMENPYSLVLWEAQFGDFANGAQVIIDQFIASGESKWLKMNGIVLLLPHGYEGQGPEHSSARLERYLQLSAQDNWQVCNVTTPANYFHILRRQIKRNFRKPLVLMTPKSLLRHKHCVSAKSDFLEGTYFHRFYMDDREEKSSSITTRKGIRRVILCSGKIYFDLRAYRDNNNIEDVHIIRLEQLYPFPHAGLVESLRGYENSTFVWCQEEPKNGGAWHFIDRRLEKILHALEAKDRRVKYIGRMPSASPATGNIAAHSKEQKILVQNAFTI